MMLASHTAQRRAGNIPRRIRSHTPGPIGESANAQRRAGNIPRRIHEGSEMIHVSYGAQRRAGNIPRRIRASRRIGLPTAALAQRRAGNIPRRILHDLPRFVGARHQRSTKGGKYSPPNLRRLPSDVRHRLRRSTKGGKYSPPNPGSSRASCRRACRSTKGGKYSPPNPQRTRPRVITSSKTLNEGREIFPAESLIDVSPTSTLRTRAQRRAGNIPRRIMLTQVRKFKLVIAQRRAGNIPRRIARVLGGPHGDACPRSTKGGKYSTPNPPHARSRPTANCRTLNEGREIFHAESSTTLLWSTSASVSAQRRAGNIPRRILYARACNFDGWWSLNEGREIFHAESRRHCGAGVVVHPRSTKGGKYSTPNPVMSPPPVFSCETAQRRAGNIPRRICCRPGHRIHQDPRSTKGGKYSTPNRPPTRPPA